MMKANLFNSKANPTTRSLNQLSKLSSKNCFSTSSSNFIPSISPSSARTNHASSIFQQRSSNQITNRSFFRAQKTSGENRIALTLMSGNAEQNRAFKTSIAAQHGGIDRPEPGTGIKVTFRDSKGNDIKTVEVNEGDDLLSIAHEYDIELEGACEGSIACSTCHVILEPEAYETLEEPGDDENDMLDLAFGLTDTSRLGCQVKITKELDGLVAQLPSATRNMYVDGHKAGH